VELTLAVNNFQVTISALHICGWTNAIHIFALDCAYIALYILFILHSAWLAQVGRDILSSSLALSVSLLLDYLERDG
jgi:hypothetical protein